MDGDTVLHGLVADGIGGTVGAGFQPTTRHPQGEGAGVVIATNEPVVVAPTVLEHGRVAKFTNPLFPS